LMSPFLAMANLLTDTKRAHELRRRRKCLIEKPADLPFKLQQAAIELMQRMGKKHNHNKNELKAAVRRAGDSITPGELQHIIFEFRRCLELCIEQKGSNFEHLMKKR